MLYINTAKVRKLIGIKRQRTWVAPGQTVSLDSFDIRTLGANAAFLRPYEAGDQNSHAKKIADHIKKTVDLGEKKETPAEKKEAPAETKETPAEKRDVAKEAKQKEANDKKALKESLEGMTKVRLIEVAEGVVGIDVKSRDSKASILKKVLKASKDKGYAYVLKNS